MFDSFLNSSPANRLTSFSNHLEIVQLLVENNADLNKKNIDGVTPLMWACSFHRLEIARCLLSTGKCEVNAVDSKLQSALIYATTNSSVQLSKEMIELLVKSGADVNHSDHEGSTVLNTLISSSSESNLTGKTVESVWMLLKFILNFTT